MQCLSEFKLFWNFSLGFKRFLCVWYTAHALSLFFYDHKFYRR